LGSEGKKKKKKTYSGTESAQMFGHPWEKSEVEKGLRLEAQIGTRGKKKRGEEGEGLVI